MSTTHRSVGLAVGRECAAIEGTDAETVCLRTEIVSSKGYAGDGAEWQVLEVHLQWLGLAIAALGAHVEASFAFRASDRGLFM